MSISTKRVLGNGYVKLDDPVWSDMDVARSTGFCTDEELKDPDNILQVLTVAIKSSRYLPFTHANLVFTIRCPMFVALALAKTRHGVLFGSNPSTDIPVDENAFYVPSIFRSQGGSPLSSTECNELYTRFKNYCEWANNFSNKLIDRGVSKEQAKQLLPQCTLIDLTWRVDLCSLLMFLKVKLRPTEEIEIQQYAQTMLAHIQDRFPLTFKAFSDKELRA